MSSPFSVEHIAQILNAEFIGENKNISGVKSLKDAQQESISFFANHKYVDHLKNTNAGACIVRNEDVGLVPMHTTAIICNNPHLAHAYVLDLFYKPNENNETNISKSASISQSSTIGKRSVIGDNTCISDNVFIGDGCTIGPSTYIGSNVRIGSNVQVGPNVTLKHCQIGDNVSIYSGVRIGEDGFGFILDDKKQLKKILQIGGVIIGDHVEIGANTCIDRGAIENTVVGHHTKIDNLVQIGHNVIIGQNCIICAQVGIAGSTVIGDYVMIGGQAGLNGHIDIGDRVQIAAQSGIMSSLSDDEKVAGYPAVKIKDWHRQTIFLKDIIKKQ